MRHLLYVLLMHMTVCAVAQKKPFDIIATTGSFRASVVKIDVTPDSPEMLPGYTARQSAGVHDPICHRIIAMDAGVNQFFIVSSHFCVMKKIRR